MLLNPATENKDAQPENEPDLPSPHLLPHLRERRSDITIVQTRSRWTMASGLSCLWWRGSPLTDLGESGRGLKESVFLLIKMPCTQWIM